MNNSIESDETIKFTPDLKWIIRILILNSLGLVFMGVMIPIIAWEFLSANTLEIGLLTSIRTIGSLISPLISGYLADRLNTKKFLILLGSLGRGGSYIIIYFGFCFGDFVLLGVGLFTLGFMAGFFWLPIDTLIAEKSSKNHRSHAYGKRSLSTGIGQFIGMGIGFLIFGLTAFTGNPFIFLSAIPVFAFSNFIAGILFFLTVDETVKISKYDGNNDIIENKQLKFQKTKAILLGFLFLLIVVFLSSINGSISSPFFTIYIMENISSDTLMATIAILPAGIMASILGPKIGKRVDKIRPEVGIAVISIIGSMLTWFLINTTNIWIFSVILFFDMVLGTTSGLIFQNLMSRITQKHRGKIMGLSTVISNLGMIIGPLLGGLVSLGGDLKIPFIISIFVEISLIPFYWVVVRSLMPHVEESYD